MPKVAALPGIPHDIVVIIISSLSNKDLSACCYVCSRWKVIAQPILQRRRVFEFSLLRGDNHWDRKRLKEWRQLIHPSNVRNVRHLALSNRHSSAVRLVKDNASCIWIFEVLQQVAPYLASLHIEYFDLAALKGTFTFPPLPMLRSLTFTNNIQKLPLILDDAFPHYSASTLLRDLVLPIVDQLSVYHLPSCGLTDLELTS
ncbi:hypothetical protein BT69DRAFT_303427 [Atractiella rhizophila]|nr:hypothetical protein BT69DRAFT_303427 [Atractiella rhizophila]